MRTRWLLGALLVAAAASAAPPETKEVRKDGTQNTAAADNLKKSAQKQRDSRDGRRKTTVEAMRAKYGALLDNVEARNQIRIHARRVARLHRIKNVAMEMGNASLASRADMLLTKEQTHFEKKMDELRKDGEKK